MILSIVVALLAAGAVFFLGLRRPWSGAATAVFFLPWVGVAVDPGVRLTAYRLALIGWMAAMALRAVVGRSRALQPRSFRLPVWGIAFFGYAALWTLLQLPVVPGTDVVGAAFRAVPEYRSLTQIGWLVLRFSPLLLLPAIIDREGDVAKLARLYLASLALLAVIGWIQLGVWWATGADIAPIGAVDRLLGASVDLRHGLVPGLGQRILRMSSFGGEPKDLGQSLAVGLLLIQGLLWLRATDRLRLGGLWLLLFTAMLATLSASAIFVWGGGTVVLTGYLALHRSEKKRGAVLASVGLVGVAGLLLAGMIVALGPTGVGNLLSARMVERRFIPDADLAIARFLIDEPGWTVVGVGLGNVHAHAAPYIPDFAWHYMEGEVFAAKSGYLRIVSQVGLVGLALFLIWMWREVSLFKRAALRLRGSHLQMGGTEVDIGSLLRLAVGIALIMIVAFLARKYLWNEALWTVAALRSLRCGAWSAS